MLEEIPLRRFAAWTVFGVAALIATVTLGTSYTTVGLLPVAFAYVFLYVLRPPAAPKVTDAELWRFIDG